MAILALGCSDEAPVPPGWTPTDAPVTRDARGTDGRDMSPLGEPSVPVPADAGVPAVDAAVDAAAPPTPPPPAVDAAADRPPPPPDASPPPPAADAGAPDQAPGPFVPGPSPRSVEVYDEARVVDLHLTFAAGDWAKLMTPVGPDDARWVPCSFRFQDEPVVTGHCRRKGDPVDWVQEIKPAMIVRFNFVDKAKRFRGLRRLNLESFDGAEAPVRDRLGMWLMREAGVNAPRVNHARVFKDGALLGLYLNIEALDKEFLEDHFGPDGEGNLWESGDELKTNEVVNDNSRLWSMEAMVEREPLTGDHSAFFTALDAVMDIPQVLREMAAETAMLTNDNYSNGSANFYYYDHPKRGFMVLPWDFDTILTTGPADADPFAFWETSPPNKLRQLINQNPAWRAQFVTDVVQIRDTVLTRMPAKLDAVCTQVREFVRADPTRTATFEDFETDCAKLRARIPERIAALTRLLGR